MPLSDSPAIFGATVNDELAVAVDKAGAPAQSSVCVRDVDAPGRAALHGAAELVAEVLQRGMPYVGNPREGRVG